MKDITIDETIFPVEVVRRACNNLLDLVECRIDRDKAGRLHVKLKAREDKRLKEDLETIFYDELISAAVTWENMNKYRELRNYFAGTAFLQTTENQKVIQEFIDQHWKEKEETFKDLSESLPSDSVNLDEETGTVLIQLSKERYLLPEVLEACREVQHLAHCQVDNRSTLVVSIALRRRDGLTIPLTHLRDSFFNFLQGGRP